MMAVHGVSGSVARSISGGFALDHPLFRVHCGLISGAEEVLAERHPAMASSAKGTSSITIATGLRFSAAPSRVITSAPTAMGSTIGPSPPVSTGDCASKCESTCRSSWSTTPERPVLFRGVASRPPHREPLKTDHRFSQQRRLPDPASPSTETTRGAPPIT